MSLMWIQGFWNGLKVLGNFLDLGQKVYIKFIESIFLKQHADFYGVFWFTMVPKILKTINFTYVCV